MASFDVSGLDDTLSYFDNIATLPDSVLDEMLNAEADVLVTAEQSTASSMLQGPYATGQLAGSIRKGKISGTGTGKTIKIEFTGSRTRHGIVTRNTEIAFVNEFGARGHPARPFIQTALDNSGDAAVEAAAAVLDKYLNK